MLIGMFLQIIFGSMCGLVGVYELHVLFRCLTAITCALMYTSGQMISECDDIILHKSAILYSFLTPLRNALRRPHPMTNGPERCEILMKNVMRMMCYMASISVIFDTVWFPILRNQSDIVPAMETEIFVMGSIRFCKCTSQFGSHRNKICATSQCAFPVWQRGCSHVQISVFKTWNAESEKCFTLINQRTVADITSGRAKRIVTVMYELFWSIGLILLPGVTIFFSNWTNLYLVISLPTLFLIFMHRYEIIS